MAFKEYPLSIGKEDEYGNILLFGEQYLDGKLIISHFDKDYNKMTTVIDQSELRQLIEFLTKQIKTQ